MLWHTPWQPVKQNHGSTPVPACKSNAPLARPTNLFEDVEVYPHSTVQQQWGKENVEENL